MLGLNQSYPIQFETWLEENRDSLSEEVIRQKEAQIQMYRDVVDVYEQMDDNDDEEKHKNDMKKVQELINKITLTPLDLPADVQAAAVGAGSFVR